MKPAAEFIGADDKRRLANCAEHGDYESRHIIGKLWSACPVCIENSFAAEKIRVEEEQRAEKVKSWERRMGQAGIPERFRDRTLATFVATSDGQARALAMCGNYAKHFKEVSRRGSCILMCGKPGTGKTHLAVAIGLYVMENFHSTVLFTTALRMMRRVKETYNRDSDKTESEAIAELVFPDLLILDEVGLSFGSDTEKQIFFDVLNERYEKRKPTIFLSNKDLAGVEAFLGERVYDRLKEDGSEYVSFTWDSYRGTAQ